MGTLVKSPLTKKARAEENGEVSDEDFDKQAALTAGGMRELMKEFRASINSDFKDDLKIGLGDLRKDVCQELKTVREETQAEFKKIREESKIESNKTEARLSTLEARMLTMETKPHEEDSDPEGGHPELLVVVSGWLEETPEADIVKRLQLSVAENEMQAKVVEIFCFSDPASSGVLKFQTAAKRDAFLQGLRRMKGEVINEDRHMKFSKKLTVVERAAEKRLGYIKNEVMTRMGASVQEVKIHWKTHEITYKSTKIFKIKKGGERIYDGVAKDVKKGVEAKVEEWLKKRMSEDSE